MIKRARQDILAGLLRSCASEGDLGRAKSLHRSVLAGNHGNNVYLCNLIVDMYAKCGSLEDARSAFHSIAEPNVFSWNILLAAYSQHGRLQEAWLVFQTMSCRDLVSWNTLLTGFARNGELGQARAVLDKVPQMDVVTQSAILTAFIDSGDLQLAKRVFDSMLSRNAVAWNAMVSAYAEAGEIQGARNLLQHSPQWNVVSFNTMLSALSSCGELEEARDLFAFMPERNQVSWNAMVAAYGHHGQLQHAKTLFDCSQRDLVTWNTMVSAYADVDSLADAKAMFYKMPQWNSLSWNSLLQAYASSSSAWQSAEVVRELFDAIPHKDVFACTVMISAYGAAGDLVAAAEIFKTMECRDVVTWNSLLAANANNGSTVGCRKVFARMPYHDAVSHSSIITALSEAACTEEARTVFDSTLPSRNLVLWNAMVAGYAQNGQGPDALKLYQEMELTGICPDEATFNSVLGACSHVGMLHDCWLYFSVMVRDRGLLPTKDHYNCMVNVLGRSGELLAAEELVHVMPFQPDAMVWGTLLANAKMHRDAELATRTAVKVFDLDRGSSSYVVLANVFAALGKDEDMALVRKKMDDLGIKKPRGISMVELEDGTVHRFSVGDGSHPRNLDIRRKLAEIVTAMKQHGYVAETGEVLHGVVEEVKEELVAAHSEKLAIGLALLQTSQSTPIRVMKNLRICLDCHAFAKFVSAKYQRLLIVRDSVRFHCFRDGTCSCADFW